MKKSQLLIKYGGDLMREVAFIEDNLSNIPLFEKWEMIRRNCKAQGVKIKEKIERKALTDYQIYLINKKHGKN